MRREHLTTAALVLTALLVLCVPVILVAQETAATPAAPSPIAEVISTQVVVSYLLSWLMQKIKEAKSIPIFEEGATGANTVLAWLFAAAQTLGIGWTFDTAAGTLMITGLSLATIVEFARAYVTQKLMYVWALRPRVET